MTRDVALRRDYGKPDDNPEFVRQERELRGRWADIALTLGVVLMPLGAFMDWTVYRDQFVWLFSSRMIVTGVLLAGLLSRRFWSSGRWFEPVSFFLILLPGLYFCWTMYWTDGSQSLYYFGLILLMIVVQMLGFRGTEAAAYCAISTLAYLLAVSAAQGWRVPQGIEAGQGAFFLTVCSVACVTVCSTYRRNRFEAYCLNRELAHEQERLRQSMTQLRETEQRLVHSEKMRAIAGVAAGLLHEINNPVNYSLMAIKVLKKKIRPGEDGRETLEDAEAGVSRIGAIISDLRSFAHPEQISVQTPFRIRDAVAMAVRFLTHELPQGRVKIDETSEIDDLVLGAQSQIVQVLLNVILNAEKAIAARSPSTEEAADHDPSSPRPAAGSGESGELKYRITIRAERQGDRLAVSVTDPGIGMEPGQLKLVKQPFFTTHTGEGLGLGLGICETIVRTHGGAIDIESEAGVGTRVTFDLPLATDADSASTPYQSGVA